MGSGDQSPRDLLGVLVTVRVPMPQPPRTGIVKRDRRWFWHPYTYGVLPTGMALYHDRRRWAMQVRYRRPDGALALGATPRTRWRLVALWHGLRGHIEGNARP